MKSKEYAHGPLRRRYRSWLAPYGKVALAGVHAPRRKRHGASAHCPGSPGHQIAASHASGAFVHASRHLSSVSSSEG